MGMCMDMCMYMFWYMLGPTPTDSSKIMMLTSGTCTQSGYLSISDEMECATLAAQLKTPDSKANKPACENSQGKNCAPVGCYKFVYTQSGNNGKLYFNTNLEGPCTDVRQCLCKGNFSLLIYVYMPPFKFVLSFSFSLSNTPNAHTFSVLTAVQV